MRRDTAIVAGLAGAAMVGAFALARGGLNPPPGPVTPTNLAFARAAPEPSRIRSFTVRDIMQLNTRIELVPLSALEGYNGFVITDIVAGTTPTGTGVAETGRIELVQGPDPTPVSYRVRVAPRTFNSGLAFGAGAPIEMISQDYTSMWVTVTGYLH